MKLIKILALALLFSSLSAQAQDDVEVRETFLKVGQAVLRYLVTKAGDNIVSGHALSLTKLRESLTEKVVTVRRGPLTDNAGATVDALGGPGYIVLDLASWDRFFEKEQDVYYLVFHEMLRAAGYNDDNYVISRPAYPFPFHLKVDTRIQSVNEDTSLMTYRARLSHLTQRCEALTKKAIAIQLDNIVPDLKSLTRLLQQMESMIQENPGVDFETKFRDPLNKSEQMLNTTARIIRYVTKGA